MTMCIILVVAAARLTSTDTQHLRNLLEEFLAGLLTTIFFLRVYTRSTVILYQAVLLVNSSEQFQNLILATYKERSADRHLRTCGGK